MKPRVLRSGTPEFKRFLDAILARRGGDDESHIDAVVGGIIADVRKRGDAALIEYTERFDRVKLTAKKLRVSADELRDSLRQLPKADRQALELAARRIAAFHKKTIEKPFSYTDDLGIRLGQMVRPLDRVGIYVPGGMGAYPSSVLMNAIPARVAGVREIVMVSPPSAESSRPEVMAAAAIAGVDEFYRVGGAHAVAALAYGTSSIAPVDKIVGPGNSYVQAAKRMVYGVVDIDKMAGPSEVLVIADDSAHPEWVAADLIAQAEHGSGDESALLLTPSQKLADAVADAIVDALADLPRAKRSPSRFSTSAAPWSSCATSTRHSSSPMSSDPSIWSSKSAIPRRWLPKVKAAGAVFLGPMSPAPFGDYLAGPNHVLPTGGSARFASPLGAYDFLKRTSIIEASARCAAQARSDGRAAGADGRI